MNSRVRGKRSSNTKVTTSAEKSFPQTMVETVTVSNEATRETKQESVDMLTKKTRGRPKSSPKTEATKAAVETIEGSKTNENDALTASRKSTEKVNPIESNADLMSQVKEDAKLAGRGKGRGRKKDESVDEGKKEESNAEEESTVEVAEKKTRGRGRKSAAINDDKVEDVKVARGRKAKSMHAFVEVKEANDFSLEIFAC